MHGSGQDVDIAAVRLNQIPENVKIYDVVADDDCADMLYPIGSDVFVLGFPKGMQFQGPFPVWKRASIASEPDIKIDAKSQLLVDTATREGMSGAPVIAYSKGLYQSKMGGSVVTGITKHFIGIYSGRFGSEDEFGAQLGRVWKRELIHEMLSAPILGSYVLKKP